MKRVGVVIDDYAEKLGVDENSKTDQNLKMPIFTYTLEDGVSKGSYGINCAIIAGLPKKVVIKANENSKTLDKVSKAIQNFDFRDLDKLEGILGDESLDGAGKKRKIIGELDEGILKVLKVG